MDERSFFWANPAGGAASTGTSDLTIEAGRSYEGWLYFQNDVSSDIENESSVNARAKVAFPAYVSNSSVANGFISADNSSPRAVWASMALKTADPNATLAISIDKDSAYLVVGGQADGLAISTDQLQDAGGVLIGCDKLDGVVSGEDRCQGKIHFTFTVSTPPFAVDTYHYEGAQHSVEAFPGKQLQMVSSVTNTSTVHLSNIAFEVRTVPGISFVPNTFWSQTVTGNTQGPWTRVDVSATQAGSLFSMAAAQTTALQPGDQIRFAYYVLIANDGVWACGGKWLPVSTTATVNGIPLKASMIVNVNAVC